jgi:hypothetical protein
MDFYSKENTPMFPMRCNDEEKKKLRSREPLFLRPCPPVGTRHRSLNQPMYYPARAFSESLRWISAPNTFPQSTGLDRSRNCFPRGRLRSNHRLHNGNEPALCDEASAECTPLSPSTAGCSARRSARQVLGEMPGWECKSGVRPSFR